MGIPYWFSRSCQLSLIFVVVCILVLQFWTKWEHLEIVLPIFGWLVLISFINMKLKYGKESASRTIVGNGVNWRTNQHFPVTDHEQWPCRQAQWKLRELEREAERDGCGGYLALAQIKKEIDNTEEFKHCSIITPELAFDVVQDECSRQDRVKYDYKNFRRLKDMVDGKIPRGQSTPFSIYDETIDILKMATLIPLTIIGLPLWGLYMGMEYIAENV